MRERKIEVESSKPAEKKASFKFSRVPDTNVTSAIITMTRLDT